VVSGVFEQPVTEGYKQTEVGVIPDDWSVFKLGSITQNQRPISYGIVQTGPRVYGGIKCLRVVDISNGMISKDDLITTTIKISNSYKRTQLQLNDLVIPLRGKVGIVDEELVGDNLTRGVALIALKSGYYALYIKQIISFEGSATRLESSMNGSALQEIPIATLRSFKVAIPSLKEQTAIANALSDVDALITSLEKLITKKRAIKTAAMQQLLTGKKRLPPFDKTHTGYKQTELGEIPEDWEVEHLGAVATSIGSGITSTKGFGEFPLYGSTGQIGTCKEPEYRGESILVARVGANAGLLNFVTGDYGVSDNTIIVKLGSSSDIGFYKYQLTKMNLNTLVFGSGQPLLTGSQLKAILLPLPKPEEQAVIAGVLSDIDKEIEMLEQRLKKTQQLKQGMMQELLTGRTRLI
jgi:type I restriction enzyme S subunit